MALYSEKVMDHFRNPRNVGVIENADGVGEVGNPVCGDIMKIYLKINDRQVIEDVKFETFGCGSAIASSSIKRKLDVNINSTGIDKDILDAVICGSDVVNRKPDPEIFLKAADKLGLSPENCLVAEDAISGVTAAKAAGMYCFGVTTTFPDEKLIEIGADITGTGIEDILKYL